VAQDSLLSASDHIYVINLPDRTDRRQEMERQLTKIGVSFTSPQVTLFPAVRPTDRGEFPSIGSRGCFLSHLGVLRDAAERGFGLILLLEDDVDFTRHFLLRSPMLPAALADCDIVYLGHLAKGPLKERVPPDPACLTAPPTTHLMLAHAIMLRR
jgi:glycosyl transferase family 25